MRSLSVMFVFLLLIGGLTSIPILPAKADSHYVTAAELPPQLLPPPPAEGSDEWKKNIQGVLAAQEHVSSVDVAAMKDEQHLRLALMTEVVSSDFTRNNYPRTYAFLDRVLDDSEAVERADKQYWHTRRPYLTDTHVKLLVKRIDDSPAYPSGHTSDTRVLAEVIGLLYPDRLADLRAKADSIAFHRVEAGVHYPGDLEGGRLLAMLIVGSLMKSDEFQADMETAKAEIRH